MAFELYDELAGQGDDRLILSYILFAGNRYEPGLGVESLVATADTLEELRDFVSTYDLEGHKAYQIVDSKTLKIIDAGDWEEGQTMRNGIDIG